MFLLHQESNIKQLLQQMDEIGVGKIATLCGRYYAMDRDNRWERIEQCYNAMVNGIGKETKDPVAAIAKSYERGSQMSFYCQPFARKTHKSIRAIRLYSLTSVLTVPEKLHVPW